DVRSRLICGSADRMNPRPPMPRRPPMPQARVMPVRAAAPPRRRGPWLMVAGTAFWYHMALKAEHTVAAWREREAKLGCIYTCASQSISGYPFRIQVRCGEPSAELHNVQPALALRA